jgi:hypothetical protein
MLSMIQLQKTFTREPRRPKLNCARCWRRRPAIRSPRRSRSRSPKEIAANSWLFYFRKVCVLPPRQPLNQQSRRLRPVPPRFRALNPKARGMASQSRSFAGGLPIIASHRRRATATPSRKAISSDPSGASRAMLLMTLRGMPGFLPVSMASLTVCAADFTAPETSATVDLGSDARSGLSFV